MGHESVIIYVGPERKRYLVHKALLTKESDYFDRALNGSFKEAEDQAIDLPEETPAAVDLLVGWLYQDKIPTVRSAAGPFATPFNNNVGVEKDTSGPGAGAFPFGQSQAHTSNWPGLFGGLPRFPVQVEMQNTVLPEPNEGTGRVAYRPLIEPYPPGAPPPPGANPTGPWSDIFQTVVAQSEYARWSPEELRLVDYQSGLVNGTESVVGQVAPTTVDRTTPPSSPSSGTLFTSTRATFFGTSNRISGIPTCPSLDDLSAKEEEQQLAILQLCLLAETFCWDTLFNRSMTAYITGEANLSHRPIRTDHLELIYQRAHESSPCRAFVSDAVIFHLRDGNNHKQYLDLTKDYPAFLEDIFMALTKKPGLVMKNPTKAPKCDYHNHMEGQSCAKTSGYKLLKKRTMGPAARSSTPGVYQPRSWLEQRGPSRPGGYVEHEGSGESGTDDDDV